MMLLFIYFAITLLISSICSLMEATLLSSSASYIEVLATKSKGGKIFKKLKTNIDRPISAILSLNTIANTAGSAGVGAQAVAVFGNTYFGIITALLTFLILIFAEIIPKSIGANYWKNLAVPAAWIILGMTYIAYPLISITKYLTRIFTRNNKKTVSREELAALTDIGEKEGTLQSNESKIINNMIRLESLKIRSIMTPRTVVFAAQEDLTLKEFFSNKDFLRHSRIPIYKDSIDNITGFVLKSDILIHLVNNKDTLRLKDVRRPLIICYENTSIPRFYDLMMQKKEHIALVIDEYGGMEGIVTMEDIIETILGLEITDESDFQIDMQQFAKDNWKAKAARLELNLDES
ncbi:MAG: hemolysin family protein [Prevotellaceae bacterium]|jgi:CBS domain containing-hemolysin-like protein|nr:hemolysin family protein [Prevotellaceae bacterium]